MNVRRCRCRATESYRQAASSSATTSRASCMSSTVAKAAASRCPQLPVSSTGRAANGAARKVARTLSLFQPGEVVLGRCGVASLE